MVSPHRICFCSFSSTQQHHGTAKGQSLGVNRLDLGHGDQNTSRAEPTTGKRCGLARENPKKSPLSSLLLAGLVPQTPLWGGGTPSPTNTGEGWSFSKPPAPISKNLRPTHNSGTQPAGLNPLETPEMRHLIKLTLSCMKSSSSLYKVHENLGKICIAIHTPASVLGGSS